MAEIEKIHDEEMLKFSPKRQQPPAEAKNAQEDAIEAQMLAEMQTAEFQKFDTPPPSAIDRDRKLDMLMGITLPLSIELGRTDLEIRSILELRRGSIIEFDKMASEPVDVIINGKKMAEGEVVVIDKHFAIRITSLVDAPERIQEFGK